MPTSWEAFYAGDVQGLWALVVPPAVFLLVLLAWRPRAPGADPRAAAFVRRYAVFWTVETILDPLLIRAGAPMLPFVLLGDFRVFLLMEALVAPDRSPVRTLAQAAAWTCVVPALAWPAYLTLHAWSPSLPDQILWLIYETLFVALALWLRGVWLPQQAPRALGYLRAVLGYAATYYALWATADVLVLYGVDLGWLLRVLPNQLYYVGWVPVVWTLFFSRRYASTSSATQASR